MNGGASAASGSTGGVSAKMRRRRKGPLKRAPPPSRGSLRFLADKRQIAGMLTLLGFCAIVQPLSFIASNLGPNGVEGVSFSDEDRTAFFEFVGACCLVAVGGVAAFVGYMENLFNYGSVRITVGAIAVAQLAWVPYVSSLVGIGKAAASAEPGVDENDEPVPIPDAAMFIPAEYDPDPADQKFVGSMGILGVLCYGFAFAGGIAFFLFSLYAFQVEKPEHRNQLYYRGRMRFYSVVLYMAGVSQLALSVYLYLRFDNLGQLENGPVVVGFYVINQPVMAGIVGLIQVVAGAWGFARTCFNCSEDNQKIYQGK